MEISFKISVALQMNIKNSNFILQKLILTRFKTVTDYFLKFGNTKNIINIIHQ